MKKVFLIVALLIRGATAQAQEKPNATKDPHGNYVATPKKKGGSQAKDTGRTYTHTDGKVYKVYESINGKLFIKKISKNGNEYNYYLKVD